MKNRILISAVLILAFGLARPASADPWTKAVGQLISTLRRAGVEPARLSHIAAPESQYTLTRTAPGRALLAELTETTGAGFSRLELINGESADLIANQLTRISTEFRKAMELRGSTAALIDPQVFLNAAAGKFLPGIRFSGRYGNRIEFVETPKNWSGDLVSRFTSGDQLMNLHGSVERRLHGLARAQRKVVRSYDELMAEYRHLGGDMASRIGSISFLQEFSVHLRNLRRIREDVIWHWRLTGEWQPAFRFEAIRNDARRILHRIEGRHSGSEREFEALSRELDALGVRGAAPIDPLATAGIQPRMNN